MNLNCQTRILFFSSPQFNNYYIPNSVVAMYDGILNLNRTVNIYTLDHTLKQYDKYALVKSHTTSNPSHKQIIYCIKKSILVGEEEKCVFAMAVQVKQNKQGFYPKLIELVQTNSNYYLVCQQANMLVDAAISHLYRLPAQLQSRNRLIQQLKYLCENVPIQLSLNDFVVTNERVVILPSFMKLPGAYGDNNRKVFVEMLYMLCFGEKTKEADVEKLRDFYVVVTENMGRADMITAINQHVAEVDKKEFGSKGNGSQTNIKYPMDMKLDIPDPQTQRPPQQYIVPPPQLQGPVQQVSSLPEQPPMIKPPTQMIPVQLPNYQQMPPNVYLQPMKPKVSTDEDIQDQINNIGVNPKMKQLASHIRNTRLSQIQPGDEAPDLSDLGINLEANPQQNKAPIYQPPNPYNQYDMRNQQNYMNTAKIVSPGNQPTVAQKQNVTQPAAQQKYQPYEQPQQQHQKQNVTQPYPAQNPQQNPQKQQAPQNIKLIGQQNPQQPQAQQPQKQPQQKQPKPHTQPQPHPQPQPQPQQQPKGKPTDPTPMPPNNPFQNKKNPNLNTIYVKKDPHKDDTDFIFSTINNSFMGPTKKSDTFKTFSSKTLGLNQTKMFGILPSKKQEWESMLGSYMSQFDLFHEMAKSFLNYYTGTNMGLVAAYLIARCSVIRKLKLIDAILREDDLFDLGADLYKHIDKMKYVKKIQQNLYRDDPEKIKAAINFKMILPETFQIMQPYLGDIDVDDRTQEMTFYYFYCLSKKNPSKDRHNLLLHDCLYVLLHTNQEYVYNFKDMPKEWDEEYVNDKKKTIELLMFKIG